MFERYAIKKQFMYSLISVIIFSLISSFLVSASVLILFLGRDYFNQEANDLDYYKKEVNQIEKYIDEKGEILLNKVSKEKLENIINPNKIQYEVISLNNKSTYGNIEDKTEINKKELLKKINKKDIELDNTKEYLPIFNENNDLVGCMLLSYNSGSGQIAQSAYNNFIVLGVTYLSPFIFIIIYTLVFGKSFSKNINNQFKRLMDASEKIKNQDLDFTLGYPYNNEVGKLTDSFENMRVNLKETLNNQWRSEKEKQEIIQALSHDLRSPLTVVKGNVELLQSGAYKNEEKLKRYLNSIEKSTNRAVVLVEDLNTLSKIDDMDFSLNKEQINIKELIKEKIEEYDLLMENKNIKFEAEFDNIDENNVVYLDKGKISRVLDNIITNSFRYIKENGRIHIKLSTGDNCIIFKIKDNGCGFVENDVEKVFQRFYKSDKSRTKSEGNSGLGLYICKQIIDKHGGTIKAFNENGGVIEFNIPNGENYEEKRN
ncbi:MAG: ATP-binding protein [Terrisporobacter sp.]